MACDKMEWEIRSRAGDRVVRRSSASSSEERRHRSIDIICNSSLLCKLKIKNTLRRLKVLIYYKITQ